MTTTPTPLAPRRASLAWRIACATVPLGVGLGVVAGLRAGTGDPSDPTTLVMRIAAGVVVSALVLGVIALLLRRVDHRGMGEAGLTSIRQRWRLALLGALAWVLPAGVAFAALALLGSTLKVTLPLPEFLGTVLLLFLAVLLLESVPEEVVFRGYVTTALAEVTRGWWIICAQALLFTIFGALLRQIWNPVDLSLFFSMGIGLGYLRMVTGSVWMPIGFHTAFQTGAQLVLTQDALDFSGSTGAAMLALGVVPFGTAALLVSAPRFQTLITPPRQRPQ